MDKTDLIVICEDIYDICRAAFRNLEEAEEKLKVARRGSDKNKINEAAAAVYFAQEELIQRDSEYKSIIEEINELEFDKELMKYSPMELLKAAIKKMDSESFPV